MADLNEISQILQKGKAPELLAAVKSALESGMPADKILQEGLLAGMGVIGERFKKNEIYIPEVMLAAMAMNQAVKLLDPHLAGAGLKPLGKIVLGTVKGDLHDIGKNLVGMMLRGNGFEVLDLGTNVTPRKFLDSAKTQGAGIVAASALLTTTMPAMKELVALARSEAPSLKVMIGGAPVTQEYCDLIGADGYAPDAARAVDVAKKLTAG